MSCISIYCYNINVSSLISGFRFWSDSRPVLRQCIPAPKTSPPSLIAASTRPPQRWARRYDLRHLPDACIRFWVPRRLLIAIDHRWLTLLYVCLSYSAPPPSLHAALPHGPRPSCIPHALTWQPLTRPSPDALSPSACHAALTSGISCVVHMLHSAYAATFRLIILSFFL